MSTIKVAVRVRPFNGREKEQNSVCIVKMSGNTTYITNLETGEVKEYAFDYSYWSHDGYIEPEHPDGYLHPKPGSNYSD